MALIRAGHPAAFEALYERYHRPVLSFCRHTLSDQAEAEDVVQHTFLAAWRDLMRSEKPIQLRAWLFTIARNRCLSVLRARREHPAEEVDELATEGLASIVQRRQDLRDLVSDLRRLPEAQRAAIVLAEIDAMGHAEIADVLGVPTPKVKALVFQARESLMSTRTARETDCVEIRHQLATEHGGGLRRAHLRRHLRDCSGCREYRAQVQRQRRQFAVVLPVGGSLALKEAVLGAAVAGGGSTVAGGAGLLASGALKSGLVKSLAGIAVAGLGTAGTVAVTAGVLGPGASASHNPAFTQWRGAPASLAGGRSAATVIARNTQTDTTLTFAALGTGVVASPTPSAQSAAGVTAARLTPSPAVAVSRSAPHAVPAPHSTYPSPQTTSPTTTTTTTPSHVANPTTNASANAPAPTLVSVGAATTPASRPSPGGGRTWVPHRSSPAPARPTGSRTPAVTSPPQTTPSPSGTGPSTSSPPSSPAGTPTEAGGGRAGGTAPSSRGSDPAPGRSGGPGGGAR